jgi:glycosyltransferase involved in cell wall biosynthesis
MRVLLMSWLAGRGGIETHFLHLSRLLTARGDEVTVASRFALPETPLIEEAARIPVRLLTTPFAGDLRRYRWSTAVALVTWPPRMWRGYDRILTTEVSRLTPLWKRFLRPRGRLMLVRAGDLARAQDRPAAIGHVDEILVETERQAEAVRREWRVSVPVKAIPHLGLVESPPPRAPRLASGPLRVTFLGRLVEDKGIFRLLDVIGDARLRFCGSGADRERLVREIARRGLGDRVEVRGPWNGAGELAALLADTDVVALLSRSEGLPLVLLEALAHGVPFVATDVGAVRELANPQVRIVREWDAEAARRAFAELGEGLRRESPAAFLQAFHRERFGHARLAAAWLDALD